MSSMDIHNFVKLLKYTTLSLISTANMVQAKSKIIIETLPGVIVTVMTKGLDFWFIEQRQPIEAIADNDKPNVPVFLWFSFKFCYNLLKMSLTFEAKVSFCCHTLL